MSRRLFTVAVLLLATAVLSASAAPGVTSSATPTLFSMRGGSPQVLAGGAQKLYPVTVSEDHAFAAIFQGGMWIPDGAGGRVYAKYARQILHPNGDWTYIGKVATARGEQSAVITFGRDAVFGVIPQASGYPLRLLTSHGRTLLLRTDGAALARSPRVRMLYAQPDYRIPPRHAGAANAQARSGSAPTAASVADGAASGPTIDVMVAYTPGLVSEYGTVSAALTRINNLVDLANQAYSDSQVHQSIRLVHTLEVNYTDANSNATALDDITGNDGNGHGVPVPPPLQPVAPARSQYGADLVVLLRRFDNATDGGCGIGWLIGGGEQPIVPSQDYIFGYSVVSDGSDAGYYCLDSTFAHELGHNMGDAHDRANSGSPGAYSYSYGYLGNGAYGFSTIMAYGTDTTTPLDVFSNPNISICQNTPCGIADNSPSSADNAHSMNNTASLIAQFEPTMVGNQSPLTTARYDVNGDKKSDLLWTNNGSRLFGYWLMNAATRLSYISMPSAGAGYWLAAAGDFNGDGLVDLVWTSAANDVIVWINNGKGGFTSQYVASYPAGWTIVGAGDVNGDGDADLLWENSGSHLFGYWLMSGATRLSYTSMPDAGPGYGIVAVGDFNGDGRVDVTWTSAAHDVVMWLNNGSGGFTSHYVASYPGGWVIVGAGDMNGDGDADLLWENPGSNLFGYWLMNGASRLSYASMPGAGAGYTIVAYGDYNADGKVDLIWTSAAHDVVMWLNIGNNGFTSSYIASYPNGWMLAPMLNQ